MALDPTMITAGVQAGTAIAQTIANISDQTKRRNYEQALGNLSNQQQQELNDKLLKANSDNERLQIISSSLVQYAIANDSNAATSQTKLYILAGIMGVALLGMIIYFVKK